MTGVDGHRQHHLVTVDGSDLAVDEIAVGTVGKAVGVEDGPVEDVAPDLGTVVGQAPFDPLQAVNGGAFAGQRGQDTGPSLHATGLVRCPEEHESGARHGDHGRIGAVDDVVDHTGAGPLPSPVVTGVVAPRRQVRGSQVDGQEAQRGERLATVQFSLTPDGFDMTHRVGCPLLHRPASDGPRGCRHPDRHRQEGDGHADG